LQKRDIQGIGIDKKGGIFGVRKCDVAGILNEERLKKNCIIDFFSVGFSPDEFV
jgi:hypothetical protein